MRVVHLIRHRESEAVLRAAFRRLPDQRGNDLIAAANWHELMEFATTSASVVAVIDPHIGGRLQIERIRDLTELCPVIVYGDFRDRSVGSELPLLLDAGVDRIFSRGIDDPPAAIAAAMNRALRVDLLEPLLDEIEGALPWRQALVVRWAVRRGDRLTTVTELAKLAGVTPRTLRRWFEETSALTPQRLVSWGRILHVSILLDNTAYSASRVAHDLDFSSYGDVCRRYRDLTGESLSVHDRGSIFATAAQAFEKALRTGTEG